MSSRREALGALGLGALAGGLGCARLGAAPPALPWEYVELDPESTARRCYELYPEGHCMRGVFESIVGEMGRRLGPPQSEFPFAMMSYGAGGVGGWGALCGAVNGAAAVLSLYARDGSERSDTTHELLRWYETAPLPTWTPPEPDPQLTVPAAAAGSVLCHISSSRWCEVAGRPFFSDERLERCKRLSADVAAQTVRILNRCRAGAFTRQHAISGETRACQSCHDGGAETHSSFGQLSCGGCHEMADGHPEQPLVP